MLTIKYPDSTIEIEVPEDQWAWNSKKNGKYQKVISNLLDQIRNTVVGLDFIHALSFLNKKQTIGFRGPDGCACAAGSAQYHKLRNANERTPFATELELTLLHPSIGAGSLGNGILWLANELIDLKVPGWIPTNVVRPFPLDKRVGMGRVSTAQAIYGKIRRWLDKDPSLGRTRDETDALMLALRKYLRPGGGTGSFVSFDPLKLSTKNGPRPPAVALFHELVHSYHNARGRQLGLEGNEEEGSRLYETLCIGLPPFAAERFTENAIRHALKCPDRKQY
ncbi:MAG: M91 family zinc metallopeptidase [Panacagrimonas sp.]